MVYADPKEAAAELGAADHHDPARVRNPVGDSRPLPFFAGAIIYASIASGLWVVGSIRILLRMIRERRAATPVNKPH
jgi:hypothetical protein